MFATPRTRLIGLAALALVATGCGQATLPGAVARHGALAARDTLSTSWDDAHAVELVHFDADASGDPDTLDAFTKLEQASIFVETPWERVLRGGVPNSTVLEFIAPATGKPHRGFLLKDTSAERALAAGAADGAKPAPPRHLKLAFNWGINQTTPVSQPVIDAAVVVVADIGTGDTPNPVGFGYAYGNNLPGAVNAILPPLSMKYNGADIPLKLMWLSAGTGAQLPCSDAARMKMPLVPVVRETFSSDFHAAYPTKDAATLEAGDVVNTDIRDILATGFIAQMTPTSCAQVIFGKVSVTLPAATAQLAEPATPGAPAALSIRSR